MGFGDYGTALAMREFLREMITAELDKQRPRYQMATVTSIDRINRRCNVQFLGDPSEATVTMGGIQPSAIGQVVRIEGLQGDRFVADVMGVPFESLEERMSNLEDDPTVTSNFAINGNFEQGDGGWSGFWQGGTGTRTWVIDTNGLNAYSGNNSAKVTLIGADVYLRLQSTHPYAVSPGEILLISWREKTEAGANIQTTMSAVFGATLEGAQYFASGSSPLTIQAGEPMNTGYTLRRALFTIPAGMNYARFDLRAGIPSGGPAANGSIWIDDFRLQRTILQSDPTDTITFNNLVNTTDQLWAWDGIIFPTTDRTFGGIGWNRLMTSLRTQMGLHGGGIRKVTSAGISWSQRFIGIGNGRHASHFASGYIDIEMPPDGTVITGIGGASNATVAAGLIPLSSWNVLYYIPPMGGSAASNPANFRLVGFTFDVEPQSEWIPIARRNADTGAVIWGDGREQDYWRAATLVNSWENYGGIYAPTGYKREDGKVQLRGLVRLGTIASPIFNLPAGFRPEYDSIFTGITSAITSGAASTGTAHTHSIPILGARIDITSGGDVRVANSLASNGYISLEGIIFEAAA